MLDPQDTAIMHTSGRFVPMGGSLSGKYWYAPGTAVLMKGVGDTDPMEEAANVWWEDK